MPYQITGARAKSNDPETWTTFEVVRTLVQLADSQYDGIGYMISAGEDLQGIDIDHCLDMHGTPTAEAVSIIATLNSYTEVSPSGNGLRVWCFGTKPGSACKKALPSGAVIEMYEKTRYPTETGHHLEGTPLIIEQRQAQIQGGCDTDTLAGATRVTRRSRPSRCPRRRRTKRCCGAVARIVVRRSFVPCTTTATGSTRVSRRPTSR